MAFGLPALAKIMIQEKRRNLYLLLVLLTEASRIAHCRRTSNA